MLHASTQQLIRKLCELTDAGAINWKEGKDQISVLETEGYVVEIQPEPPSVRLLRGDGHELESADASDLAMPWGDNQGTFADHVADMARRANRYARGAETAIAKILSSLSAPPKKVPEPEPEPAALAFVAAGAKTVHSVPASESAAAIAAVNADLDSQRRRASEDLPVSHSVAEAPAPMISPETETAIDRVLAVQPPVVIEKPKEEVEPPKAVAVAPVHTPKPQIVVVEARPAPALPEALVPEPVVAAIVQPAAPLVHPVPAAPAKPAPTPVAKAGFGGIDGFARPQPSAPKPDAPASSGLSMMGFNAQSRQAVESASSKDFYRPPMVNTAPQAQPPQPPATPVKSEQAPQPAKPGGTNIYKPWV